MTHHRVKGVEKHSNNLYIEVFNLRLKPELLHRHDLADRGLEYKGTLGWFSKNQDVILSLGKTVSSAIDANNHDLEAYGYQADVYEAELKVKHGARHLHVLSVVGNIGTRINPIPHFDLIVSETNRILEEQRSSYNLKTYPE